MNDFVWRMTDDGPAENVAAAGMVAHRNGRYVGWVQPDTDELGRPTGRWRVGWRAGEQLESWTWTMCEGPEQGAEMVMRLAWKPA